MIHSPSSLVFSAFNPDNFLSDQISSPQINYVRNYLKDLGAQGVLEEPNYFDRDYLSEFSNFYGQSAEGYPNICKRLHIFGQQGVSKESFKKAIGGDKNVLNILQQSYLGFIVVRPIKRAPLGKTVLAWYPETTTSGHQRYPHPRIVEPSREYKVDICGIELTVNGLAWQQQDEGIAACATIALWSMLQSSALDDYHFIPTTSEITEAANKTASLGSRVYPSKGLTISQMCEALKEVGLSPCAICGDIELKNGQRGFSVKRFVRVCSSFIRSGYPLLLAGEFGLPNYPLGSRHAICAVGFRENPPLVLGRGEPLLQDEFIHHLYIHDDNLGPNVRFRVFRDTQASDMTILKPDRPDSTGIDPMDIRLGNSNIGYSFIPSVLLGAVNKELRSDPDELHNMGKQITEHLDYVLKQTGFPEGLTFNTRFIKKVDYMKVELSRLLEDYPEVLSRTRLELIEKVRPISKHIGLLRIGSGPGYLFDVLFDTSDSYLKSFALVSYLSGMNELIQLAERLSGIHLGQYIEAK